MHEGGMQIFKGDGSLTTAENRPHKQEKAIIDVKNGCGERRLFKNPIAVAKSRAGETPFLIVSINAAASGSH